MTDLSKTTPRILFFQGHWDEAGLLGFPVELIEEIAGRMSGLSFAISPPDTHPDHSAPSGRVS